MHTSLTHPGAYSTRETRREKRELWLATENTEKDYGIERLGIANMNVLYKYCDQAGIEILRTLKLKLPYVSQVNDPLECLPVFYRPEDDIPKELEEFARESMVDLNRQSCLLSVSKTAQNTVMWAHYANKHEGVVIGIDFNNICLDSNESSGILMNPVSYSKDRPKIKIWPKPEFEELKAISSTKSIDWLYEKEFRTIFPVEYLEEMQQLDLAHLENFKGKKTWFLRLKPASIREVIFGLYTDDSLKSDIRKLIERQDLQHVKLRQAEESETYTLNLK